MQLEAVLAIIEKHPESDLSAKRLAEVACVSEFHFQRRFHQVMGVTVQQYCQSRRLQRAALTLMAMPGKRVIDIALQFGYQSVEHFSRVFKQQTGVSPSAFRLKPNWRLFETVATPNRKSDAIQTRPVMIHLPAMTLALLDHYGAEQQLITKMPAFMQWRRAHQLSPQMTQTFTLYFNDPTHTARPHMGVAVAVAHQDYPLAENMRYLTLPEMEYAEQIYQGEWQGIGPYVAHLLDEWLPAHGRQKADCPLLIERLNFPSDTPPQSLMSKILVAVNETQQG